jgi:hypothetical protein
MEEFFDMPSQGPLLTVIGLCHPFLRGLLSVFGTTLDASRVFVDPFATLMAPWLSVYLLSSCLHPKDFKVGHRYYYRPRHN